MQRRNLSKNPREKELATLAAVLEIATSRARSIDAQTLERALEIARAAARTELSMARREV